LRAGLALVVTLAVAGCGEKDPQANPEASVWDLGGHDQKIDSKKLLPDLGALPDLGTKFPCQSEWTDAIHAQSKVSTGAVATTEQAGEKVTTVDATAGGMSAAFSNPYVYVSFDGGGVRVDLDDFDARTSTAWDLAFRRAVIRVNGGDSGAGQGAVAILPGKTLAEVTAVPASGFAQDDFLDDKCKIKTNPINDIWTAIGGATGMWYAYDMSGMKLTPNAEVYVFRTAKGKHLKLVVEGYYKGTAGANYTLRWSML
jgi:hypothetical protein